MARHNHLLLALLGLLLISSPLTSRADEYEDDDDEEAEIDSSDEEKDVVVLTGENFDGIVGKSKFALVEFYAPWCGHCKSLKPEWAKAATGVKAYDADIVVGKVDVTENGPLGEQFGVKGFPTIKWFVNGEFHSDFNAGRDAAAIKAWIIQKSGPATVTITTQDELAKKEKNAPVTIVAYIDAEGDAYSIFKELGAATEGVTFVDTSSEEVATALGLKKIPSVAVISNFVGSEREVSMLEGEFTKESLAEYLSAQRVPLTVEFTQENSEIIFKSGIDKQVILWGKGDDIGPGSDAYIAYAAAAKSLRGKLMFVTSNAENPTAQPITNYFGLSLDNSPQLVGIQMEKQKKYALDGEVNAESILKFTTGMADGTVQPTYKSAEPPAERLDKGVTVVVGKEFEKLVLDTTKDVLLEVYAPWCGHCKTLEPIYADLAKVFSGIDSVVIAKMDGTENEHSMVEAKGFPTIIFFPAGADSKPVPYEGARTLDAMADWLKENGNTKFELPDELPKGASEDEDEYEDAVAADEYSETYDEETDAKDEL